MKTTKLVFFSIGIFVILLTVLPLSNLDYWWIRMLDFPHLQLTFLTLIALILYLIKIDVKAPKDYAFIVILIICGAFQLHKIYPYTPLAPYEVQSASSNTKGISIYTCNVHQKNDSIELVLEQIKKFDPDIVLLTETNQKWTKNISNHLNSTYEYKVEIPLENTYGMLLYSRLKLFDANVRYLVSDSVPSIHSKILISKNDTIQLRAIHPTPPMPQENDMSTDRDTEMMMIAKMALDSDLPVVTVGDFNDVAWSKTSVLFQEVSRLLDVRKGRGLFNTFDANNLIMRWPLDHIFISSEFRLKSVEKCEDVNSDHFPLYTELSYEPELANLQRRKPPSEDNLKAAEDQIKIFNANDKRITK